MPVAEKLVLSGGGGARRGGGGGSLATAAADAPLAVSPRFPIAALPCATRAAALRRPGQPRQAARNWHEHENNIRGKFKLMRK